MFQKFNELFNALNQKALDRCDEDLTMIEESMRNVLAAWTQYLAFSGETFSDEDKASLAKAISIVLNF